MTDQQFIQRATAILHNMSLERRGSWRQFWRRWHISDEPLRHDASNLLRERSAQLLCPVDCQPVGYEKETK